MRRSVRIHAGRLLVAVAMLALFVAGAGPALAEADVASATDDLDSIRALAMRGLIRAQELRTAHLYARGFGISSPQHVAEDMVIEGLWLFDYLHSMDNSAMSLLSYAKDEEHPYLEEELEVFKAYLPEAARMTIEYYDKTSRALVEAVDRANKAAVKSRPTNVEVLPAKPWTDNDSARAIAGDGLEIGWKWPMIQAATSAIGRHFAKHGQSQERIFQLAADAGIGFVCPDDRNLFDWIDAEKEEGRYDWSRIDALLARCKKYDIALWLPLPSYKTSPPRWLRERLGDRAVLSGIDGAPLKVPSRGLNQTLGINDIRKENNPVNLFDPEVSRLFARYIKELIEHIKQAEVRIVAVQLGDDDPLPPDSGLEAQVRFKAWLKKNKIEPRERWGMDLDLEDITLPPEMQTAGVEEPGRRQMLLDVVRFREDEYIEYFRTQVDAIREAAPELPICTQSCDRGMTNESMNGRPNERLIRELGLMSYGDTGDASIWDDLRRSYSPVGRSVTKVDTGSGDTPAQHGFSSYMHGTFGMMSSPLPIARGFAAKYSHNNYHYPDMRRDSASLYGWRRFHERAQAMWPEMVNTKPAPRAAILWSDTSNKYQSFIADRVPGLGGFGSGVANYHKLGFVGWGRILNSLCMAHDVVTEEQVRQGALTRYEMLVMPAVQALPADVAARIREHFEGGGLVVATSAPALFDDKMVQKGVGQLADVLGADFDGFLPRTAVPNTAFGGPTHDPQGLRTLYCAWKPHNENEVVERFATGQPAVVVHKGEKGRALLIGYPVGREAFATDSWTLYSGATSSRAPNGSWFMQSAVEWFRLRVKLLDFAPSALVASERIMRGSIDWTWTRRSGDFRDYSWDGGGNPRSVELGIRKREGNPNLYLTLFNREGGGGQHDPGVIHYESTSKNVGIKLKLGDILRIYDVTLGCSVPFTRSGAVEPFSPVVTFNTHVEPSSARMFVISINDYSIRTYAGKREFGPTDQTIRDAVQKLATDADPPEHTVIGLAGIDEYLTEKAVREISISAESPLYVRAAKRLAAAIEEIYHTKARVTRTSPRRAGPHDTYIERPHIFLGSHNESHYISIQKIFYQRAADYHTARLPIFPSHTFPGADRSITVLMRPYPILRLEGGNEMKPIQNDLLGHEHVVIGASNSHGLELGIDNLIKLLKQ